MNDVTGSGEELFPSTQDFESLGPSVITEEVMRWLKAPLPVAFMSANGRVLACNALGAWVCGLPSASEFFLQNIYDLTAELILSEQIPIQCNHVFRRRKMGAMGKADPGRDWPAHRNLYQAVRYAEREYKEKSCPIHNCGITRGGDKFWRYPLCIWEPGTKPGGSVQHLLRFQVTDALLSRGNAPRNVPDSEKRFLVVFEPVNDQTLTTVERAYVMLTEGHTMNSAGIAPRCDEKDLHALLDKALRSDLKYTYHYINENIMEIDVERLTEEDDPLGLLIRSLRARLDMSGDELAQQLGVSRATISNWEQGYRTPPRTLRFARSIVSVLDPTDDERRRLLRHVAGTEATLESLRTEGDVLERTHPDEEFYESMMKRAERIQSLGAQVVRIQSALDQEVEFMRSSLKQHFLNPEQIGILDPLKPERDSSSDMPLESVDTSLS